MNSAPSLYELRDLHRRCTSAVIQNQLRNGKAIPNGWWLYSEGGQPGTNRLRDDDLKLFFCNREDSPEGVVLALGQLARSYLVVGGAVRTELSNAGRPLPRALILIAPPSQLSDGEVVKTFVLTEHQLFLAISPVKESGKAVQLANLELMEASLTHNQRPGQLS